MSSFSQVLHSVLVLAQEAAPGAQAGEPSFFEAMIFPMMMIFTLYIIFVMMPQNRDRKSRQEFYKNLKKNDQVVTVGGIYGTISGFSADGEQVTLRVDDNTRLRVRKSSIESIIKADEEKPATT